MRILAISVICICGVFFLASCQHQRQKPENYIVNKVEGPLTDQEVEEAFNAVGLQVDRFEVAFPQKSNITFTTEMFRDGKSTGIGSISTGLVHKGLEKFMISKLHNGDKMYFSVGCMGFDIPNMKGYNVSSGLVPVKNPVNSKKQPVYFMAANKDSSVHLSLEDFDLDSYVRKYDFAMVIYVSAEK